MLSQKKKALQEIPYCQSAARQDVAAGVKIWEAEVTREAAVVRGICHGLGGQENCVVCEMSSRRRVCCHRDGCK